jgi:hypothetical protein
MATAAITTAATRQLPLVVVLQEEEAELLLLLFLPLGAATFAHDSTNRPCSSMCLWYSLHYLAGLIAMFLPNASCNFYTVKYG